MTGLSESVLVESRSARSEQLASVSHERAQEILAKVKALYFHLWQGAGIGTTEQMAEFYEVPEDSIKNAHKRHKDEFELDGVTVLRHKALRDARVSLTLASKTSQAIAWTPRSALRLGMILEKSEVAKQVRTSLLDAVEKVLPAKQADLEILRLQVEVARANESSAKAQESMLVTQERVTAKLDMLSRSNPVVAALAAGKADVVVEKEHPITVLVDQHGRPIEQFDGVGITFLAKQYGFGKGKKANDRCRAWLRSLGIKDTDWVEEPSAHVTRKLPRELLSRLDQAFYAKQGDRQFLMGE